VGWVTENLKHASAQIIRGTAILRAVYAPIYAGVTPREANEKVRPALGRRRCGRSGRNLGLEGARAKRARRRRRCCCRCSSALRQKRAESRAGGGASEASKKKKTLLLSLLFCSAAEAGMISGCRGDTPRTPPAAGSAAHVLGRSASHMCSPPPQPQQPNH
jgi:hypothetical protein